MNKILVINVNWVGDVVFSSPVFKALKEAYPQAVVSCMAVPRVKEVLERIPYIDEIIVYDEKGTHWNPLAKLGLILKLSKAKFDGCFLLHGSLTRALLVYLAGIPVRVGYNTKNRGFLLTHAIDAVGERAIHRSDHYARVIESFGIEVKDRRNQLTIDDAIKNSIRQQLLAFDVKDDDFTIVVNPGGNWDLKRWAKKNYALLIHDLVTEFKAKVILCGASKDESLIREILEDVPRSSLRQVINLAGKTDLKGLMGLMAHVDLVISADSGPLHIANSVGTDVIGLFGPTRPEITGPRGTGKSRIVQYDVGCNRGACYFLACPDNTCMQAITVRDIKNAVRQIKNT